jgi:hypothetical protein
VRQWSSPLAHFFDLRQWRRQPPRQPIHDVKERVFAMLSPDPTGAEAQPLVLKPPLMLSTWPVIHEAPSEARKATEGATSSGVPSRRSG